MVDKILIVLKKKNRNIKMFEKECRKLNIYYLGLKNGKFIYYTLKVFLIFLIPRFQMYNK